MNESKKARAVERIAAAKEKLTKLALLAKEDRASEENRCPAHLRQKYFDLVGRRRKALTRLRELGEDIGSALSPRSAPVMFSAPHVSADKWSTGKVYRKEGGPVKFESTTDEVRAQAFTREGMKAERTGLSYKPPQANDVAINEAEIPLVLRRGREFIDMTSRDKIRKIYERQAQSRATVDSLLQRFQNGEDVQLNAEVNDVHAVAQVMKQYVASLDPPLIPPAEARSYAALYAQDKKGGQMPNALHALVNRLGKKEYSILKFICDHLCLLKEESEKTNMEALDLAEMWAPCIFVGSNSRVNDAMEVLIEKYDFIFSAGSDSKSFRTFEVQEDKKRTIAQEYGDKGFVDNRYDYMARGY